MTATRLALCAAASVQCQHYLYTRCETWWIRRLAWFSRDGRFTGATGGSCSAPSSHGSLPWPQQQMTPGLEAMPRAMMLGLSERIVTTETMTSATSVSTYIPTRRPMITEGTPHGSCHHVSHNSSHCCVVCPTLGTKNPRLAKARCFSLGKDETSYPPQRSIPLPVCHKP